MHRILYVLSLSLFFSCQPSSLEEFRAEGSHQLKQLILKLRAIETREDLVKAEPELNKIFDVLVNVMIQARLLQQRGEETVWEIEYVQSQFLLAELKRIYALEGGKECIERAQREAMLKLDGKEKMWQNKQKAFH